jgi:hypothetical protein
LLKGTRGIVFHHVKLEELRYAEGASRLLHALGVPTPATEVRVPTPQNIGRLVVNIDPTEQMQIRRLIAKAAANPPPVERDGSVIEALRDFVDRIRYRRISERRRRQLHRLAPFDPTPSEIH